MPRYKGTSRERVDPALFAEIFERAEPFEEIENRLDYSWTLTRGVPIKRFEFSTRSDYATDPDLTEEEAEQNVDRIEVISSKLQAGEPLWPIIVDLKGDVIDGYHRLTVADEEGIDVVDVLVPKRGA